MESDIVQIIAAAVFGLAIVHTFATKFFEKLSRRMPKHAGLFHLLGEVEVVFGFWSLILILAMSLLTSSAQSIEYLESRQYTEPLFVFVIMVLAASKPILVMVEWVIVSLATVLPGRTAVIQVWLGLAAVPVLGSFITEPAAMTLAALMLAPQIFRQGIPEPLKYAALGVLFVNISVGGTLTSYAAPPVLMVATVWEWNTAFMATTFGWKGTIAVLVNATAITLFLARHIADPVASADDAPPIKMPVLVSIIKHDDGGFGMFAE